MTKKRFRLLFSVFILFALGLFLGRLSVLELPSKQTRVKQVTLYPVLEHKPFVFIIPSFNNSEWVEKNLRSVFEQKYDNFRVIYIDDASTDATLEKVKELTSFYRQEHRVEIWHNETNRGAAENIYRAAHSCSDREILILCDGDDWMAGEHVLKRLNEKYADPAVWATFGSYVEYPKYSYTVANFACPLPLHVVKKGAIRAYCRKKWSLSHLRTFYAGLFKQIKRDDLLYQGSFYDAAYDLAFMIPIAEMAGKHLHFVNEIFYIYNRDNLLNDNKVRFQRQQQLSEYILSLPCYAPVASPFAEGKPCEM